MYTLNYLPEPLFPHTNENENTTYGLFNFVILKYKLEPNIYFTRMYSMYSYSFYKMEVGKHLSYPYNSRTLILLHNNLLIS